MVLRRIRLEQNVKPADTQLDRLRQDRLRKSQAGMTLIELMVAMTILAVGLAGIVNVLVIAMETDLFDDSEGCRIPGSNSSPQTLPAGGSSRIDHHPGCFGSVALAARPPQ